MGMWSALLAAGAFVVAVAASGAVAQYSCPDARMGPYCPFELRLLKKDLNGAACLDGSPPGFYWRPAPKDSPNKDKWVVSLFDPSYDESVSLCASEQSCLAASRTIGGSSKSWYKNMKYYGVLSTDKTWNRDFYDWNLVAFQSCDGSAFSGNRNGTLVVDGTPLYMRGHLILNALFKELQDNYGFRSASSVLLAGELSGGLAAYLHADYVYSQFIPQTAVFKVLAGSGYYMDYPNYPAGKYPVAERMQNVFKLHKIGTSNLTTNAQCMSAHAHSGDQWKCFMAQYVVPHIQSPLFTFQSLYDMWQLRYLFKTANSSSNDPIHKCLSSLMHDGDDCTDADIVIVQANKLHDNMLASIKATQFRGYGNGAFLHACYNHGMALSWHPTENTIINGKGFPKAIGDWYFARSSHNLLIDCRWDDASPYFCNPTCSKGIM